MYGIFAIAVLFFLAACSEQTIPSVPLPKEVPPPIELTVEKQSPTPGSSDVSITEPIEVTFSVPIKSDTLNSKTVVLKRDGNIVPIGFHLSEDHKTLVIDNTNLNAPATNYLSVELGEGITDLEGNALKLPVASWKWSVKQHWKTLDEQDLADQSVVLPDAQGGLYAAYTNTNYSGPRDGTPEREQYVFVEHYDGSGWVRLGDAVTGISINPESRRATFSMQLDSQGHPVVAWSEYGLHVESRSIQKFISQKIYVKRWNGSSWDLLEDLGVNTSADTSIYGLKLVLDQHNNPMVYWQENYSAYSFVPSQTHLAFWRNHSWQSLYNEQASSFQLTVDGEHTPTVAWLSSDRLEVRKWNGNEWLNLKGTSEELSKNSTDTFLIFSSNNIPYATLKGELLTWSGENWHSLGFSQLLGFDASGAPVQLKASAASLQKWVSGAWQPWIPMPAFDVGAARFVFHKDGHPSMLFLNGNNNRLFFSTWDEKQWSNPDLITSFVGSYSAFIDRFNLFLDANDQAIVEWSYTLPYAWGSYRFLLRYSP